MLLQSKKMLREQNYQVLTTVQQNSLQFWCTEYKSKEKFKNGLEKRCVNRYINPNLKETSCHKYLSICSESYFSRQKSHSKLSKYCNARLNLNFQRYVLLPCLIRKTSSSPLSKALQQHQTGFYTLVLSLSVLFVLFLVHAPRLPQGTPLCARTHADLHVSFSLFSEVQTQNPTCSFLLQPWGDLFAPFVFPIK